MSDGACLYLIQCGNMVKVGMSKDPVARLSTLQTASPDRLELAYVCYIPSREAVRKAELSTHRELASRRRAGEWFCVDIERAVEAARRSVRRVSRKIGFNQPEMTFENVDAFLDYLTADAT